MPRERTETKAPTADDIAKLPPLEQLTATTAALAEHQEAIAELATIRARAVRQLRAQGMSVAAMAELAGVTRQNIHRLLDLG